MKRVRCPKCESYITFDESRYAAGQLLRFSCPYCGKQFSIRLNIPNEQPASSTTGKEKEENVVGHLIVIENNYCFQQDIPLHMGRNVIGRHMRGNDINCAIETGDLTMDLTHCVVNVSRNKQGRLKFVLSDGPSYHGTFVAGERLDAREKREIVDGMVFNIGVTTIIFHTQDNA